MSKALAEQIAEIKREHKARMKSVGEFTANDELYAAFANERQRVERLEQVIEEIRHLAATGAS